MSTKEVRVEALLKIRCIVKGYHLSRFEVNTGEVFTANKKRGERGNAFKVVNQRGQSEKEKGILWTERGQESRELECLSSFF